MKWLKNLFAPPHQHTKVAITFSEHLEGDDREWYQQDFVQCSECGKSFGWSEPRFATWFLYEQWKREVAKR